MHLSIQKVFYVIVTFIAFFALLVLAKSVLIPLAFALLIAFILYPVCRKFESWGTSKIIAASLSMFSLFLVIAGSIYLFSNQIIHLSENFTEFKDKIVRAFADVSTYVNKNMGFVGYLEEGELYNKLQNKLNESLGTLLNQTFNDTSDFLIGLVSVIVFTFLILIYRNGLVNAMVLFYDEENRNKALEMFKSIQKVGQQYLFGMLLIVLILGFVNSIGLLIIGLDNPFLFGFLAAVLAIVPYAGTLLGASIPVLYAFMYYDSIWVAISIAIFFWVVQFIESNFLSPKIVGGNLKLNALTSILSIIIGATVWGVAGMILFLPYIAMFKVFCKEYTSLKPVVLLVGDEYYTEREKKSTPKFLINFFENLNLWYRKMYILYFNKK